MSICAFHVSYDLTYSQIHWVEGYNKVIGLVFRLVHIGLLLTLTLHEALELYIPTNLNKSDSLKTEKEQKSCG
jgi:hypothetical protein